MKRICWFISAHGFGHAARSTAIMEALFNKHKDIEFLVVSEIPPWFFEQNKLPITFFSTKTDVGLVQKDAFFEDIPKTAEHLIAFYFNLNSRFRIWDEVIKPFQPDLIVADICPAALEYADSRNIPSVLTENFTWNWLYEFYTNYKSEFSPILSYMESAWKKATLHIQMKPYCGDALSHSKISVPVSRKVKDFQVAEKLNLDSAKKTILMTMGGVPMEFDFYERLKELKNVQFIIPGAHKEIKFEDNLRLLTHHSIYYHPDLVHASDVVIAKVGYSTLAEVHNAGTRLAYIPRYHFRETEPLVQFVKDEMSGLEIHVDDLNSGNWISRIDELLNLSVNDSKKINGADFVANEMSNLIAL